MCNEKKRNCLWSMEGSVIAWASHVRVTAGVEEVVYVSMVSKLFSSTRSAEAVVSQKQSRQKVRSARSAGGRYVSTAGRRLECKRSGERICEHGEEQVFFTRHAETVVYGIAGKKAGCKFYGDSICESMAGVRRKNWRAVVYVKLAWGKRYSS
jgi:hypothetical protein